MLPPSSLYLFLTSTWVSLPTLNLSEVQTASLSPRVQAAHGGKTHRPGMHTWPAAVFPSPRGHTRTEWQHLWDSTVGPDASESWGQDLEPSETQPLMARCTHVSRVQGDRPQDPLGRVLCIVDALPTSKAPPRKGRMETKGLIPKAGFHAAEKGTGWQTHTSAGRSHGLSMLNE